VGELQRLIGEPGPRRRIDLTPRRVKGVLRVSTQTPRFVLRIVPGSGAAADVTRAATVHLPDPLVASAKGVARREHTTLASARAPLVRAEARNVAVIEERGLRH